MPIWLVPTLCAIGAILVIHSIIMILCFVWIGELKEKMGLKHVPRIT